ncbi:MAG: DNA-directed RNA polymerase subunit omega [Alphaproteobacteria bacterium]
MARLTITDCLQTISDKYKMIILSAQRARQLYSGATATIQADDRKTVVALREIAKKTVDIEVLETNLIKSFRRVSDPVVVDETTEENDELKQIEAELS